MGEDKKIEFKATNGTNKGSQFVFWNKQDPADSASPEELAAMEAGIVALREGMPMLKGMVKISGAKLGMLKSAPSLEELSGIVEALRAETRAKSAKLLGVLSCLFTALRSNRTFSNLDMLQASSKDRPSKLLKRRWSR